MLQRQLLPNMQMRTVVEQARKKILDRGESKNVGRDDG